MDSEIDIEAVAGDAGAMARHPRANIEALRDELTRRLRTRLAGIGWQEEVQVGDDPYVYAFDPGYLGFLVFTDGWYENHVQMPGVPLEVVRTAPEGGPWTPLFEGERRTWESLLDVLTDDAAMWEMYWPNMLAFIDDVAARGGPRLGREHLKVDVDGSGDGQESFWAAVPGGRIHVGMHGDTGGRDADRFVYVQGRELTWEKAVAAFVHRANGNAG